jgi:nitrate reductase cytochrome c-type subunit
MPKSRNRKDHKKKVASRNKKVAEMKRKNEKMQREMIMKLIEQEKQKGLYDNLPPVNPTMTEGPQIDLSGPQI